MSSSGTVATQPPSASNSFISIHLYWPTRARRLLDAERAGELPAVPRRERRTRLLRIGHPIPLTKSLASCPTTASSGSRSITIAISIGDDLTTRSRVGRPARSRTVAGCPRDRPPSSCSPEASTPPPAWPSPADEGFGAHALSFRYGQRHTAELDAAAPGRRRRRRGRAPRSSTSTSPRSAGRRSPATSRSRRAATDAAIGARDPVTYVPARNTVFLAYALAWAEVLGRRRHLHRRQRPRLLRLPRLPARVHRRVRGAWPTWRPGPATEGAGYRIHAPLLDLTKAEIVAPGLALGVDYGLTVTCYDAEPTPARAGACDACLLRRQGFADAGVADPTRYR